LTEREDLEGAGGASRKEDEEKSQTRIVFLDSLEKKRWRYAEAKDFALGKKREGGKGETQLELAWRGFAKNVKAGTGLGRKKEMSILCDVKKTERNR